MTRSNTKSVRFPWLPALLAAVAFAAPAQAQDATRKPPRERTGVWLTLGLNMASVQQSEKGCPGGQYGIAVGRVLYLRLQETVVSYERNDTTDSCDGIFVGDSTITERSATGGIMLGNSGFFLGAGPSRVHLEEENILGRPKDSTLRLELGWTSRKRPNGFLGGEVILFHTPNEFRNYTGLAFNAAFGLRW